MATTEELKAIQEMGKEAGYDVRRGLPAGTYHVKIAGITDNEPGSVITFAEATGSPRLGIRNEVVCGEQKDRAHTEFYGWYSDDPAKQKIVRGIFWGAITDIVQGVDGPVEGVVEAMKELKQAEDFDGVSGAYESVMAALADVLLYARVYDRKDGQGSALRYIKSDSKQATCGCKVNAGGF